MSEERSESKPEFPVARTQHDYDERQQELFPEALQRVLAIEQQRIESANRRTDVAFQAVKASDESDRRQFEFQMAKLKVDADAAASRHSMAQRLVAATGLFSAAVIALFLGMSFFGSEHQSEIAIRILTVLGIGGGGYGVLSGILNVLHRLMRSRPPE